MTGRQSIIRFIAVICLMSRAVPIMGQDAPGALVITRIKYSGGGDWYADPSSLSNLIAFTQAQTGINIADNPARAEIGDEIFYGSTYLYMTGHGNVNFTEDEANKLRSHLLAGAFLHADDNYGMNKSFRREMAEVFPDKDWVELPLAHPIFSTVFHLENGLPKIHEHDNQRPQALGLFHEGRLIVLYTYESDLGDGWEDEPVHGVPADLRESALQMGANIIAYVLNR